MRGIRGLSFPREDFMSIERDYQAPTINEDAINKALEAVTVRKEANDAISNATDQYEADVADFKNTQATEIEQGIATLPEILNLSETPFIPEGIGSFTPPSDPIISRMPNENAVPFIPSRRDEQIFLPPPFIQDIDERDFRDTIGNDVPGGGGINYDDIGMPLVDPDPFIDTGGGGRRGFDDTGFGDYIIEDPIIPPMIPPVDLPIDNPYIGIFKPPINMPPIFDDIGYPPDDIGYPPFDDIIFPPYDPPIDPPEDPPITPPPPPPPPVDEGPTGPINYYTGKPISNPYTPYSTDSGAAPLTRTMNPRTFGQAPGFERKQPEPIIIKPPRELPPKPPQVPPRFIAMSPKGANSGGYLNNGISMLPMNGQGDTLTTQVFQSGFRPRR